MREGKIRFDTTNEQVETRWIRELPSLTVGLPTLDPVKAFQDILGRQPQNYRPPVRAGCR